MRKEKSKLAMVTVEAQGTGRSRVRNLSVPGRFEVVKSDEHMIWNNGRPEGKMLSFLTLEVR